MISLIELKLIFDRSDLNELKSNFLKLNFRTVTFFQVLFNLGTRMPLTEKTAS